MRYNISKKFIGFVNAFLNIFNRVLFISLALTSLYLGFGLLALFIISLFSNFFTLIINFRLSKKFLSYKFWNKINWDKEILKPALIFSILSFTVLLTTRIDLIMISILGTSKDVGIYGVPYQITHIAMNIRNLVATAFFPIFVKTIKHTIIYC